MDRRIKKEVLRRKMRWKKELLPRVQTAARPNASHLDTPRGLALLQHVSDGVNEVLMTRPLNPFAFLAEYLRHAVRKTHEYGNGARHELMCKLTYHVEADATSLLILEMHKKRRIIENTIRDTKSDETSSKELIRCIIALEQELQLPDDELRLLPEDHGFLAINIPNRQEHWSIDTPNVEFPKACDSNTPSVDVMAEGINALPPDQQQWLRTFLDPQRDLDSYHEHVMEGVTKTLVQLQVVEPENSAQWLIAFFKGETSSLTPTAEAKAHMMLFFKTNYELMCTINRLKHAQREMHARWERLQAACAQLNDELELRNLFITKLSESHLTMRTQAIMDGTPVFLNSQKQWVIPGHLLLSHELFGLEKVALQRAEAYLMQKDETRWRYLLITQQRYDMSVRIQSAWRCARGYRKYKALKAKRKAAAIVIQRNYFHYLFHRAIRVPQWCVLGREVVVAPSIAQKCAISFQFYPKKDFSTGNYKRLDASSLTIAEMMEICRVDEECAGVSTDGAMKRFLPRKLSQLQPMKSEIMDAESAIKPAGLYVKVYPSKADPVANTGIITAIPDDRFGLVRVVLDGIAMIENVPLAKLSDRWKRIRIKLFQKKQEKKKRMVVIGGKLKALADDEEELEVTGGNNDFEKLEEDEEEEELRWRWKRVRTGNPSSNRDEVTEDGSELIEYFYEDQATKRLLRKEPEHTFEDPEVRVRVIQERKQHYDEQQRKKYETKRLESIVRLQCAWRSKRARDAFRQVIALRAKEKEREVLVNQVHDAKHDTKKAKSKQKTKTSNSKRVDSKPNFFSKWFK
uniref:Uncharacterized protein n=1 Tax=Globisporangium ultimum (strain ATCC 200006 / CBS 805.95 / DAOM BR144) TaxID=431595 RepID=K3XBS6_GLOUD